MHGPLNVKNGIVYKFVLGNAWWTVAALQNLSVRLENNRSVPKIVLFFFFLVCYQHCHLHKMYVGQEKRK